MRCRQIAVALERHPNDNQQKDHHRRDSPEDLDNDGSPLFRRHHEPGLTEVGKSAVGIPLCLLPGFRRIIRPLPVFSGQFLDFMVCLFASFYLFVSLALSESPVDNL